MHYHQSLLAGTLSLTFTDQGQGRPYLLLHGGAGPASLAGLAAVLAATGRSVLPTYPGFDGESRPDWLASVAELATVCLALLDALDLRDVVLIGNSVGGWLATELALRASPRCTHLVLLNAVGLDPTPASGPIVDPLVLSPAERGQYAFFNPARSPFAAGPPSPVLVANQQALHAYAGAPFMHDPTLRARLTQVALPTLVLWGEADRIVTPAYGQQFADLIPGARFELVAQAGHFPQLEQLALTSARIRDFAA